MMMKNSRIHVRTCLKNIKKPYKQTNKRKRKLTTIGYRILFFDLVTMQLMGYIVLNFTSKGFRFEFKIEKKKN